jgi:hypothetical protein
LVLQSHIPDDTPQFAIDYWKTVERWFASTRMPPEREPFRRLFNELRPISEKLEMRTFDRYRAEHRQWVGRWPPKFGQRPPWEADLPQDDANGIFNVVPDEIHHLRQVRTPVISDEGEPAVRVDEYDTVTRRIVHSFIEFHVLAAAFPVSLVTLLDLLSDGQLDHVIRWCLLFAEQLTLKN